MSKRIETNSGVYRIKDKVNGKFYYGSSLNINGRMKEHLRTLRQGIHENQHLQNAFNRDGEKNFEFTPILSLNTDGMTYEDVNYLIRAFEQICIDYFECCDREKGFNKSESTECATNFFSRESLKLGQCSINEQQFDKIVEMLMDNRNSYREIGDTVGVDRGYIKQIAQKRILVKLTEDYDFPKRYNQGQEDVKKYKDIVIQKRKQGESFKQIAEELGISSSRVEKIFHFQIQDNTGKPKKVNQFTLQRDYIQSFPSVKEARIQICIRAGYISRACNRTEGWGFSGGFLWSYYDSIPEMTILEKLINQKILPSSFKPIVSYNTATGMPMKCYKNAEEAEEDLGIDKIIIRTNAYSNKQIREHKKDIYFQFAEDVPEKDLEYLYKSFNKAF